jgi:hypothetical protein
VSVGGGEAAGGMNEFTPGSVAAVSTSAVLMVLFVAQQRGQCGGVGESLHRRRDFADGEVVVIVDGEFISGQAAGQHAGAVQGGLGAACPFSGGDLLGLKQCGVARGGQGIDRGFGDGADP